MESALFRDLGFVLAAALLGGATSILFRLPLLTGYIISGVIFAALSGVLHAGGSVFALAQLGIIFLLFTVGIELSFTQLTRVFRVAVAGGIIQILTTVVAGLVILPSFGLSHAASLILAFGFSLSSTAVVVKLLQERAELDTLHGEILTGWLLVQDLAVVPMVVLLPTLVGKDGGLLDMGEAASRAVLLVVGAVVAGRFAVPQFMNLVVRANSREFFLLAVVTFIFGVAFLSQILGISPALGAFLAGLIVSETSQNHAVFAEVRPLREIFMILFFVSLGALLSPSFLLNSWQLILTLAFLFLGLKFLISLLVTLLFGYHAKTAFWTALGLANIGEFSFLLAALGGELGLLSEREIGIAVSVALVTLLATPLLFAARHVFWERTRPILRLPVLSSVVGMDRRAHQPAGGAQEEISDHVVLCGFGRLGSWLGRACQLAQIPFVVVEYNHEILKELSERGIPFVYGDPGDKEVLAAAEVDKARLLVIAIPDRHTQELVIGHAKQLSSKVQIISRVQRDEDRTRLMNLGISEVIQPEFEAALSVAHRIFQAFGLNREEVAAKLKTIKAEHTKISKLT